ncbi:unnamed protein product [Knipowitschia caucasica]|uniref:Uncharacterized protein n=1 Tax=Knipowitschia caucasica TaxID=637954 RepID=A0AAV2IRJ6_KNICA
MLKSQLASSVFNAQTFEICEWLNGELILQSSQASEEGKDFVHVCLSVDPTNRIRLEEIEARLKQGCTKALINVLTWNRLWTGSSLVHKDHKKL